MFLIEFTRPQVACVRSLIEYVYTGEISVQDCEIGGLVEAATVLQVRGIATMSAPPLPPQVSNGGRGTQETLTPETRGGSSHFQRGMPKACQSLRVYKNCKWVCRTEEQKGVPNSVFALRVPICAPLAPPGSARARKTLTDIDTDTDTVSPCMASPPPQLAAS